MFTSQKYVIILKRILYPRGVFLPYSYEINTRQTSLLLGLPTAQPALSTTNLTVGFLGKSSSDLSVAMLVENSQICSDIVDVKDYYNIVSWLNDIKKN